MRHSEENYRTLIEQASDGIFIADRTGRYVDVNRAGCALLGYTREELLQLSIDDISVVTPDRPLRLAEVRTGGALLNVRQLRRKDGELLSVEISATRLADGRYQGIARDITERQRAEDEKIRLQEQLAQAQKMETVGRLAGGVAHDFNNMLAAILMRAELGLMQVEDGTPMQRHLSEIQKTAQRSADLTRQLLGFARKQTIAPKVLDINTLVDSMNAMLQRIIGEQIELVWRPQPGLWPVKLDPSQVDQILMNLVVNARDAIADEGRITIEMGNVTLDEEYHQQRPDARPGDYVMLAVSDNGTGMDQQTLDHIFEPFFTTKVQGKGTGLGLATVYGIVQQNRGFIQVYSEPQFGSTFNVYLPRSLEASEEALQLPAGVLPTCEGITVLLVEDEDAVLAMGVEILERLGYGVLAASSPAAALRCAGEHDGPIDLLITDVIMPGMNGRALAEQVTALRPAAKVLYISGYPADFITDRAVLEDGVNFLQKPFSLRSLALKVHAALEEVSHAPAVHG